jgi:ketosteroid isomerase-like protein
MSEENVERLKAAYEALNRGDFDAAVQSAHPEIEFVRTAGLPPLRGVDALRAWMEPDAWEAQTLEPLDVRANGNKVLVHQRNRARGAGSGIEMEAEAWAVWTFDDEGRATRLEAFLSNEKAQALEAAGLQE